MESSSFQTSPNPKPKNLLMTKKPTCALERVDIENCMLTTFLLADEHCETGEQKWACPH
jgi:hypothetical protein